MLSPITTPVNGGANSKRIWNVVCVAGVGGELGVRRSAECSIYASCVEYSYRFCPLALRICTESYSLIPVWESQFGTPLTASLAATQAARKCDGAPRPS